MRNNRVLNLQFKTKRKQIVLRSLSKINSLSLQSQWHGKRSER